MLPGLSLRTGLILVLGVRGLVTLFLVHHHSFMAVSKLDYALHVQQAQFDVQLHHVGALTTNAAQAAAIVPLKRGEQEYALLLLANYYGKSSLHLFQPPETLTQLAVQQVGEDRWGRVRGGVQALITQPARQCWQFGFNLPVPQRPNSHK